MRKRVIIELYLASGQTVRIRVKAWETKDEGGKIHSWTATGAHRKFTVNPSAIVGWKTIRRAF